MENSRKLNLTSHFFLRLPRKAESVYVHVCVCAYHIRILSHTAAQKMLCVWQLADSLTVTFTDWWRQHTITCRMCIQSCVCFWMHVCCYICVWEKRGNVWCFTHQTWFQSLSFTVTRMEKLWMWHCVRDVSFFLYLSFSVSAPPRSSQTFPLHIKTYENCCTLPKLIGFMYCRSKAFAHTHTHILSPSQEQHLLLGNIHSCSNL